MRQLNVAILGTSFMGKAHSNGWTQAPRFFELGIAPVLKVACGQDEERTRRFAATWGWHEHASDWRQVIARDDIDIVDIALPTHLHHDVAIAAARAGKHVFCEKPMALSLAQARAMRDAVDAAGVVGYVNHNYRRLPAVMLARQLIDDGRIGRIFHWRGAYQQDWIVDPRFPLTWHLRAECAGSGPHADLNSHSVDLAHLLVGGIASVSCLTAGFVGERPLAGAGSATFQAGEVGQRTGRVTVEDASLMMVRFANGAIGSFEATRFASGRKNRNAFEIYGSDGALSFDLERLNELQFHDHRAPSVEQGFRTILATDPGHAYMRRWWPPGHTIGYEHTFVHAVADFLTAIERGGRIRPDFADGVAVMEVLEAGLAAMRDGRCVQVADHGTAATGSSS
ncbi:MAG TPA: Gfo/Idh/MocA family oxidoreductase [Planctomycetota bacterium]|nr:Gfo/Idh/MocA family oxidoreductase [Planctomycetota bacterium]